MEVLGTKKQFTPEDPASTRRSLIQQERSGALEPDGPLRKLGYNTEVLGFERVHNTTKRSAGRSLEASAPGAAPAEGDRSADSVCQKLPDGRSIASSSRSCGCTTSRNSSHGQCRRIQGVSGPDHQEKLANWPVCPAPAITRLRSNEPSRGTGQILVDFRAYRFRTRSIPQLLHAGRGNVKKSAGGGLTWFARSYRQITEVYPDGQHRSW